MRIINLMFVVALIPMMKIAHGIKFTRKIIKWLIRFTHAKTTNVNARKVEMAYYFMMIIVNYMSIFLKKCKKETQILKQKVGLFVAVI